MQLKILDKIDPLRLESWLLLIHKNWAVDINDSFVHSLNFCPLSWQPYRIRGYIPKKTKKILVTVTPNSQPRHVLRN